MAQEKENKIIAALGKRAELSVQGKAVIGVVAAILMLIAYIINGGKKQKETITLLNEKESWLESNILIPALSLEGGKKFAYLSKFGLLEKDSVIVEIISNNAKGGKFISYIDYANADSILDSEFIHLYDKDNWLFYINSIKANDLIIIVKDSMVKSVLVSATKDSNDLYAIYPVTTISSR